MTHNLAQPDRIIRILLGLLLVGLFFTESVGLLGLLGGVALIASGVLRWCAVYRLLGFSTNPKKTDN